MADPDERLSEATELRELDTDIKQEHVAVAMMYVFPRFSGGLIQPKSSHKMVEYKGERCLAIAVKMDNPVSDFQLDHLRGNYPDISPGYPDWFFQQEGDCLYVGIPMSTILSANEGLVAQSMAEFGNYDVDFKVIAQEEAAEAIVSSLVDDFGKTAMLLDLSVLRDEENS